MARRRSFSLSELLAVVAVILILTSLLIVSLGEVYGGAERLKCQHRLEQISYACQLFSNANDGRELRCLDPLGKDTARWYERLVPYLAAKNLEEAKQHVNCPAADAAETSGGTGSGRGGDMPVLIYRTTNRSSYGSYEGIRDDLRASEKFLGGCDLIQFRDPDEAGVISQAGLDKYGQLWVFSLSSWGDDAFHPNVSDRRDPEPIKVFRERYGGGLFLVGDHSGYLPNDFGVWNVSLNVIADHCKLGICVRHARSHNENVRSTGHFIGNGITWLPKGTAWGSVGHVSIDDRVNDERTERHQFVSYPIVCTGEQPGGDHCPWPDKIPPGVHDQPCGVIGVMDDGSGRVCVGATFTRWNTSYYSSSENRPTLSQLAEQIALWLAGGHGLGGDVTYGYNNQIGVGPDDKGRGPTTPNPGQTIRVLDYMFYEADHDGKQGADDDATCIAPRHGGRANVLFADGHVKALTPEEIMDPQDDCWSVFREK